MSIFLVGSSEMREFGGASDAVAEFVGEAAQVAAFRERALGPRIAMIIVHEGDAENRVRHLEGILRQAVSDAKLPDARFISVLVAEGEAVAVDLLEDVDAVVVAGGLTPAYRKALHSGVEQIRALVSDGVPYLGFSAGAQLAAEAAMIGGWRIGGVPVVSQRFAEGLDEVSVAQGIGLIDITVDVHAAQWGTLTRLIASVEAGLMETGIAIDENTALVVGQGALRVIGDGSVWRVQQSDRGVLVSSLGV
ncbi:Type 1 glutamine amidotransferase-like domain-containing protein [Lysinibacter sp. HNR]|uniref:Type 1 glutamine amidotransferase-like domain-containing protein n=1 Tax=Lysinibacter sp. HNR TaxID=3031408 RepID=UPI002435819C|nr:Type 1 glutamine amidotransferase-like domain-containing protein [Lysinibacter sp. HNR]WGD36924.1 Type 1 glutamine amidotransferase-like domain-containing protein [Lysinibacter sp. HNR]